MSKDEWKKLNKNEWKKWVSVVGRMLLAYALVFAQGAWAGQNQATKDKAEPPQQAAAQQANEKQSSVAASTKAQNKQAEGEEPETAAAEEKSSRDGRHEGIKVHGHWTIEVKNPDGTVVTHREFENSIQASGTAALSSLLVGNQALGPWQVDLIGSPQPCVHTKNVPGGFPQGPVPCVIVSANAVMDGVVTNTPAAIADAEAQGLAPTLTVTASSGQLVLNGTAIAATTTSVSSVATVLSPCIGGGTVTSNFPNPSTFSCPGLLFPIPAPFTSATLATPIPVSTGQTIAVTVNISFS